MPRISQEQLINYGVVSPGYRYACAYHAGVVLALIASGYGRPYHAEVMFALATSSHACPVLPIL